MALELEKAIPAICWVGIMRGLKEGKENGKHFPMEKAPYLRNQASSTLKYQYTERVYKVNKLEGSILVYWKRRPE